MAFNRKEERDDALYKEYTMYCKKNERDAELPVGITVRRFLRENQQFFIEPATAKRIINTITRDTTRRKRLENEIKIDYEQVY